jgi:hypothetical protein
VTAVPRPQQAKTRGQLVVHRTDSEQESSRDTPPTTTTTGVEIISTSSHRYYRYSRRDNLRLHYYYYRYYYNWCRDNLHLQNQKELRSIVPEKIILYVKYSPLDPYIIRILVSSIVP